MSAISKKRMDALIPLAIDVINEMQQFFVEEEINGIKLKTNKISKTYHGYFSSFGADMINSTPLAAIIFFEESDKSSAGRSSENKALVPKAILNLIKKEKENERQTWPSELSKYYKSNDKNCIDNISAAAAALKIALRTFPKPQ